MNGVHDCGGMEGFGPIVREPEEPVFHHEWEGRVFALSVATDVLGHWNLDEMRHAIERMGAAEYLSTSYYEHWLHYIETLLVEKGILTAEELSARRAAIRRERRS